MKQQLIDNLEAMVQCLWLSMHVDVPGKVILNMGRYINQDEMSDLLAEFATHPGLSYRIALNADNDLTIEIFIKE